MRLRALHIFFALALGANLHVIGQQATLNKNVERKLNDYFLNYKLEASPLPRQARMTKYRIDDKSAIITIFASDAFANQDFTPKSVSKIYKKVRKLLPDQYKNYKIRIAVNGMTIDNLATAEDYDNEGMSRLWGNIDYKGEPWVQNISKPNTITKGLYNRHLSVYASHGRYFDNQKGIWKWQRPVLFGTTEDLFTPTVVVPFLIPMLENAGATVFTPRERDMQTNEVIVDNDAPSQGGLFQEYRQGNRTWSTCQGRGFAFHTGVYVDNENPFVAGTARMIKSTKSKNNISFATYTPSIPEAGRYAVYVSYKTVPNSVKDAEYIVFHKGQETRFHVNQQMGGDTWVYLGTFEFDKGCSEYNRVVVTNYTSKRGTVTTDAVRFGGGMGNIQRGGQTSLLPRSLEGARYTAQWFGAPYSVYSSKGGKDDYSDDINSRPLMANWLAGGSVYVPTLDGKCVPIELSLAVHSDAGYSQNGKDFVGSLSICTTNFNNGFLNAGIPRVASKVFAQTLLDEIEKDLDYKYKAWKIRYLWDRNYSETRNPEMPSAIIETLSHQNFPDMAIAQDPNFKFTMARAIYKSILKYISSQHGKPFVVQPLQPRCFQLELIGKGKLKLSWKPQTDPQEPTARATSYNLYTATGSSGFDNGQNIVGESCTIDLEPDVQYNFKVTAVNDGGESFPTETLSAVYHPGASKTILVVNGFNRVAAPAIVDNGWRQGFDLSSDIGVSYGPTEAWTGLQTDFDTSTRGVEGPGGLGYGGSEMVGQIIAGNDFNYVTTHTSAIAAANTYNIVSCAKEALATGLVSTAPFACIDLVLGLEKYSPKSQTYYKTFSQQLQKVLRSYMEKQGRLLVSGSFIGSDMQADDERAFLRDVLQISYSPTDSVPHDAQISGLGLEFSYHNALNKHHYAATHPEILHPLSSSYCAMQYSDGTSAAVANPTANRRSFTMGFPFECITSAETRSAIMRGILNFLLE